MIHSVTRREKIDDVRKTVNEMNGRRPRRTGLFQFVRVTPSVTFVDVLSNIFCGVEKEEKEKTTEPISTL